MEGVPLLEDTLIVSVLHTVWRTLICPPKQLEWLEIVIVPELTFMLTVKETERDFRGGC